MRFVGEGAILCNVLHVPTKPSSTADCLVLASTVENRRFRSKPGYFVQWQSFNNSLRSQPGWRLGSHAHTRQRVDSCRFDLRRHRFQGLKEHQNIGDLVRSQADRVAPLSLSLNLQIAAHQFDLGDLRYRDGSALPGDSRCREADAAELHCLSSLQPGFYVLHHGRHDPAENDPDSLVRVAETRCDLQLLAIMADQFQCELCSP